MRNKQPWNIREQSKIAHLHNFGRWAIRFNSLIKN